LIKVEIPRQCVIVNPIKNEAFETNPLKVNKEENKKKERQGRGGPSIQFFFVPETRTGSFKISFMGPKYSHKRKVETWPFFSVGWANHKEHYGKVRGETKGINMVSIVKVDFKKKFYPYALLHDIANMHNFFFLFIFMPNILRTVQRIRKYNREAGDFGSKASVLSGFGRL